MYRINLHMLIALIPLQMIHLMTLKLEYGQLRRRSDYPLD